MHVIYVVEYLGFLNTLGYRTHATIGIYDGDPDYPAPETLARPGLPPYPRLTDSVWMVPGDWYRE